ncbi:hypothetical protein RCL_jg11657.t1 [Rhizophagus clarus]|uniref:Uncharacterized protein n=1 Tax=Rhizophagus clarus TaxID=94130 RepID=A0A8H3MDF7_9GLOM|nr:hypothetical protein RCL_jg11657.t1 [Rhizophagus clarus]
MLQILGFFKNLNPKKLTDGSAYEDKWVLIHDQLSKEFCFIINQSLVENSIDEHVTCHCTHEILGLIPSSDEFCQFCHLAILVRANSGWIKTLQTTHHIPNSIAMEITANLILHFILAFKYHIWIP